MANSDSTVMIFSRKFNQEKNRFEIAEDFFDEFENCDVLGINQKLNSIDNTSSIDIYNIPITIDNDFNILIEKEIKNIATTILI